MKKPTGGPQTGRSDSSTNKGHGVGKQQQHNNDDDDDDQTRRWMTNEILDMMEERCLLKHMNVFLLTERY